MSELIYGLAVLACPVGMGAMMWFMMRGGKSQPHTSLDAAGELARMREEIDRLRAGQPDAGRSDGGRHRDNVTHR